MAILCFSPVLIFPLYLNEIMIFPSSKWESPKSSFEAFENHLIPESMVDGSCSHVSVNYITNKEGVSGLYRKKYWLFVHDFSFFLSFFLLSDRGNQKDEEVVLVVWLLIRFTPANDFCHVECYNEKVITDH